MSRVKIGLSRPYEAGGKMITEIELREPILKDRRDLGPVEAEQYINGGLVRLEMPEVIGAYLNRCLCEVTPDQIEELPLADAERLFSAVKSFFYPAMTSPGSPTSSSSTSGGTRDKSKK